MPHIKGAPTYINNYLEDTYQAVLAKNGGDKGQASRIAWTRAKEKYSDYFEKRYSGRSDRSHGSPPTKNDHGQFRHRPVGRNTGGPGHRPVGHAHTPSPHIHVSRPAQRPTQTSRPAQRPTQTQGSKPGFFQSVINRKAEKNRAAQGQGPDSHRAGVERNEGVKSTRIPKQEEIIQRQNQARMDRARARDITQEKQIQEQHAIREAKDLRESRTYEE
jgi:hypothetical protein